MADKAEKQVTVVLVRNSFRHKSGDVVKVSESQAKRLVDNGHATLKSDKD
jgi:hypothetical protein